ncbi:hypothetical protein HSB1_35980 [Halogranum salarium B-1]|uniref:Uncharacterized protein n=1 Tax=Halogranum salarium B-1 TaxID=1210908 RepID=J3JE98_9EURY|nr:hypothetical protein HSB1_35980 [Halogranum salarium B-1]
MDTTGVVERLEVVESSNRRESRRATSSDDVVSRVAVIGASIRRERLSPANQWELTSP